MTKREPQPAKPPPPDTLAAGWPDWRTRTETRPRDSAPVRPVRAVPLGRSVDLLRSSPAAGIPSGGEPSGHHERAARQSPNFLAFFKTGQSDMKHIRELLRQTIRPQPIKSRVAVRRNV